MVVSVPVPLAGQFWVNVNRCFHKGMLACWSAPQQNRTVGSGALAASFVRDTTLTIRFLSYFEPRPSAAAFFRGTR